MKSKKDHKMLTFGIFIKKWEYEKISDSYDGCKIFEFWPIFPLTFDQKIITQKIVIWLLKRSALMRWIRWWVWKCFKDNWGSETGTFLTKIVKTPKIKQFLAEWMSRMKFLDDLTLLIEKKNCFFTPYPEKLFFFQNYHYVLKLIVLTSWKHFLIHKINQRSFRTRITRYGTMSD